MPFDTIQSWQVVPTLAEFGDFDTFGGGELQIQYTDYIPAGQTSPRKLPGTHTYSQITLSRGYDPRRDRAIEDWYLKFKNGVEQPRTLTLKFLNAQKIVEDTRTYPVAKPASMKLPDGKSGGNE